MGTLPPPPPPASGPPDPPNSGFPNLGAPPIPGPPGPSPRRRTGLIIGIVSAVVVVLVLVGAAGTVWLVGNSKADGYDDDVAAWVDEHRDSLVELTEEMPEDLYKVHLGDTVEDFEEALEIQIEACESVSDPVKQIGDAIDAFPTLSGPWGVLSSSFRSASDRAGEYSGQLEQFEAEARKVLEQLQTDCDWNLGLQQALVDSEAAWVQIDSYLLQPGEVTDEGTCDHENGCYPFDLQEREAYLQAREAAWAITTGDIRDAYADADCTTTSMADLCTAQVEWIGASAAAEAGYVAAIRAHGDSANGEVQAAIELAGQVEIDQAALFRTALFKQFPEASDDEDLQAYPGWTDAILSVAAGLLFEDLRDHHELLETW